MFIVEAHPQRPDIGLFLFPSEEVPSPGYYLLEATLGAAGARLSGVPRDFIDTIVDQMAVEHKVSHISRPHVPAVGAILGISREEAFMARRAKLVSAAIDHHMPTNALMEETRGLLRLEGIMPTWMTHDGQHGDYVAGRVIPRIHPLEGSPIRDVPAVRDRIPERGSTHFVDITAVVRNGADSREMPELTGDRYVRLGQLGANGIFQKHVPVPLPKTL